MKITFLGGAGTVTGSKYLVEVNSKKILVDCGLFQGRKDLRLLNWQPLPLDPSSIDAVVLTHAHLDHSGYLPILVRRGFSGPVITTEGTRDLCAILLPDSGYLLEKDAEYANRRGFSKHHPAKPLYTKAESERSLKSFRTLDFETQMDFGNGVVMRLSPSGHILGSAFVTFNAGGTSLVFSGDLGLPGSPTMVDPVRIARADYLVVESTYGDRNRDGGDTLEVLGEIIRRTASRGGTVLIPSFAVGRAQTLLYYLSRLKEEDAIPDIPVFLDSPMAINASDVFCRHIGEHRLSAGECNKIFGTAQYVRTVEDSKALDHNSVPRIIISASGMATGGRVLHHLKHFAPDHRNTIVFAGFQADGTRGDRIVRGETAVKIHGAMVPIRAEVETLPMLSAHADQGEILNWLRGFEAPPRTTFITHGEPNASLALSGLIDKELGWNCVVPQMGDTVDI